MYEWDENKRKSNLAKHGLDFADIYIFDWNNAICSDTQFINGEERDIYIGASNTNIITVVIIEKVNGIIRIISMRNANKTERAKYYDQ